MNWSGLMIPLIAIGGMTMAYSSTSAQTRGKMAASVQSQLREVANVQDVTGTPTPGQMQGDGFLIHAQSTRAALDNELARARNTAEMAAVTATEMAAEARSTQMAIEAERSTQQALAFLTLTAQARATETQIAFGVATSSTAMTATVQAPLTRRAEIIADWQPWIMGTIEVFSILLGIMLCWMVAVLTGAFYRRIVGPPAEEAEEEPERVTVEPILVQETSADGRQVMQYDLPIAISQEAIKAVAEAVIGDGASFSRAALVDTHILTDGQWDVLRWWMLRRGYAQPINRSAANSPWSMTVLGRRFLEGFLSPTED